MSGFDLAAFSALELTSIDSGNDTLIDTRGDGKTSIGANTIALDDITDAQPLQQWPL